MLERFYSSSQSKNTNLGGKLKISSKKIHICHKKKSRIQDTKHLSTDEDSSTETTAGWTKNTPKPNFFGKRKNLQKAKTQKSLEICQN